MGLCGAIPNFDKRRTTNDEPFEDRGFEDRGSPVVCAAIAILYLQSSIFGGRWSLVGKKVLIRLGRWSLVVGRQAGRADRRSAVLV
jgi:hypothetical protein